MRVCIYGNAEEWESALELLAKRPDIEVVGLCDPYVEELAKTNSAVYTMERLKNAYDSGEVEAVVVLDASLQIWNEYLALQGIRKSYAIPTKYYNMKDIPAEDIDKLLMPYGSIPAELRQIEFHLADHCNLNCRGCSHFSNLVKEPVFADFDQFSKDLERLNELFDNIRSIFLLGGEALLNENIADFMYEAKRVFPYTKLTVVSNGLLVLAMKERTLKAFRETDALLSISDYQVIDTCKIKNFLEENKIKVEIREGKEFFTRYMTKEEPENVGDVFKNCQRRQCTFLGRGKLGVCCMPFTIKYFNEYFDENMSDEGAIDLYEEGLTGLEIMSRLSYPIGACKNCTYDKKFEWSKTSSDASIDDWLA